MAGENDPLFVNYPVATSTSNYTFSDSWDFHLKAGSPALNAGTTNFVRNFPNGLTVNGILYTAPEPSSYIGAFGLN